MTDTIRPDNPEGKVTTETPPSAWRSMRRGFLPLSSAIVVLVAVNLCDRIVAGRFYFSVAVPAWSWYFVVRTACVAFASALIVWAMVRLQEPNAGRRELSGSLDIRIGWAVLALGTAFVILTLLSPATLCLVIRSEGPVEKLQTVLLFFSCISFIVVFFRVRHLEPERRNVYAALALFFVLVFFVMAMEEESWFQMDLNFRTPGWFPRNQQDELNFHNFATDKFNVLYYCGTFLFLVLIPFLYGQTRFYGKFRRASFFVPSESIILVSSIGMSMFYTHWTNASAQVCFYATLFILVYYQARVSSGLLKPVVSRTWLLLLVVTCALSQMSVLIQGPVQIPWNGLSWFHNTPKEVYEHTHLGFGWDVSEYREFFVPLAFAVFSVEMLGKSRKIIAR